MRNFFRLQTRVGARNLFEFVILIWLIYIILYVQACSEMVMPIGHGSKDSMFPPAPFNLIKQIHQWMQELVWCHASASLGDNLLRWSSMFLIKYLSLIDFVKHFKITSDDFVCIQWCYSLQITLWAPDILSNDSNYCRIWNSHSIGLVAILYSPTD